MLLLRPRRPMRLHLRPLRRAHPLPLMVPHLLRVLRRRQPVRELLVRNRVLQTTRLTGTAFSGLLGVSSLLTGSLLGLHMATM